MLHRGMSSSESIHQSRSRTASDHPQQQQQHSFGGDDDDVSNPSTYFHNLHVDTKEGQHTEESTKTASSSSTHKTGTGRIGQVSIEILQCFGLPFGSNKTATVDSPTKSQSHNSSYKNNTMKQKNALPPFALAVCGKYAFQTESVVPTSTSTPFSSTLNPTWVPNIRRACIIPIDHAYARIYIGILRQRRGGKQKNIHPNSNNNSVSHKSQTEKSQKRDIYIGRVVVDIARLRPGCGYDVTLPLRQSSQVYIHEQHQLGAIRFRVHLQYDSERRALLSYLPMVPNSIRSAIRPNDNTTIHCGDVKSFQNVARVVHGNDMPSHFSIRQMQATIREINLTRIHVLRYLRKIEFYNLYHWQYPVLSGFVFTAWMHSVYYGSIRYVPGHLLTYLLLHLYKNYATYGPMNASMHNGLIPPTWEELFMALLGRNSVHGANRIEPLVMQTKNYHRLVDPYHHPSMSFDGSMSMSQHSSTSSLSIGKIPLKEIAVAFEDGVHVQSLRYHFRMFHNVFRGHDAVTFLVTNGFSTSRNHAITIGRRLAEELHLFEHVTSEHRFDDKPLLYHFNAHHERYGTVIHTHIPWGKNMFRLLGFLPSRTESKTKVQMEMPYTDGVQHPRIKVNESLYLPFHIGAKKSFQREIEMDESVFSSDDSDAAPEEADTVLDDFFNHRLPVDEDEVENESVSDQNVQYLKKPPIQDMAIKNKNEKSIPVILNEARNKVHGVLLHLFNDRTYKLPAKHFIMMVNNSQSPRQRNLIHSIKSQRRMNIPRDNNLTEINGADEQQQHEQCEAVIKTEYDKLLGIGKYSHPNIVIARCGLFVQPIIEIAIGWLSLFRALFNIFTWQDSILSFWVSVIGPIVIVILHIFPWRFILGIVGLVLFGPHNWLRRILRERKYGPEAYDPDKIVHRKNASSQEDDQLHQHDHHVPLFSNYIPGSNGHQTYHIEEIETTPLVSSGTIRQVVVPYSQLMYSHRFYDWPPENEHTRITAATCTDIIMMEGVGDSNTKEFIDPSHDNHHQNEDDEGMDTTVADPILDDVAAMSQSDHSQESDHNKLLYEMGTSTVNTSRIRRHRWKTSPIRQLQDTLRHRHNNSNDQK